MRVKNVVYRNGDPVPEREARALAINEALRVPLSAYLDKQTRILKYALAVGSGLGLVGLVVFVTTSPLGLIGLLLGGAVAGGGYYYATELREPEVELTGVQKRYWTGYSLPSEDGTLLYDATATVPETEFRLERVEDESVVQAANETLADIEDLPVVMAEDDPVEEEVTGVLGTVEDELVHPDERAVEAPVFTQDSQVTTTISQLLEQATEATVPAATAVELSDAAADLEALSRLGNLAEANPIEEDLDRIRERGQGAVDELSTHQDEAIAQLNDHLQTAADAFGIVSYHFYCPDCHDDEIQSRLVVVDSPQGDVYCETCRSYHAREEVIPRHKLKDDLVLPIWDQLWAEKADEKRAIYRDIENQKRELREREYEQSREEIRTTTERIRELRSKIRDLQTRANAATGTVNEIGQLMVKYERINEQRKETFTSEVEEAFAEIDRETEAILEQTRTDEQQRLQQAEEEAERKAELLRIEEQQRQAELLAAQNELQQAIAQTQMAHQEQLTEAELEQAQDHHQKEWLLETRGETSFSDTINGMKYRKDELLGATARGR